MKMFIIYATVLLVAVSTIYCQNIVDPPPMMFTFRDANSVEQTTYINHSYFPQKKFLIGWQWGDLPRVSYEVSSNMSMGGDDMPNYHPWGNTPFFNLVTQTSFMLDNAASFQYEPTLLIPVQDRGKLVFRSNDSQHSVFGFSKVLGTIFSNGENYHRLVLNDANLVDSVILDNPWINNELRRINDNTPTNITERWSSGEDWYVSINLRRLTQNNDDGNEVILEIELPYVLGNNSTGSIRFDSLPDMNRPRTYLNYLNVGDRGYAMELYGQPNETRVFQITKNMLPKLSDGYQDITISAHFLCDNNYGAWDFPITRGNIYFKPRNAVANSSQIDELGIKVTYKSNYPIAIDWIRIENGDARNMYRGYCDLTQTGSLYNNSFRSSLQNILDRYSNSTTNKFFRLYVQNGDDGSVVWNWGKFRYLNKLFGGIVTASVPPVYANHYRYYIEGAERWANVLATTKYQSGAMGMPYYKPNFQTGDLDTNYGFNPHGGRRGFSGYWPSQNQLNTQRFDSLISGYETQLLEYENGNAYSGQSEGGWLPNNVETNILQRLTNSVDSNYLKSMILYSFSYQPKFEIQLFNIFKEPGLLFSDQPW